MPLTPEQVRAVCRIDVKLADGTWARGTGFLIDRAGRVVTAAHVVAGAVGKPKLRFAITGAGEVPFTTEATVEAESAAEDWALLRCDAIPPAAPFVARALRAGHESRWETYGFSEDAKLAGRAYGGVVRAVGGLVQLRVDEHDAKASGLSGGPCLVNGFAAAILSKIDDTQSGVPIGGAIYAVPLATVARTVSLGMRDDEPPYAPTVAQKIAPAEYLLASAARSLPIPNPAAMSHEERTRVVAEEMMRGGVPSTIGALVALIARVAQADARLILRWSAQTWIEAQALAQLWALLTDAGRKAVIVLMNASKPQLGRWYVERTRCAVTPYPGEPLHCREVLEARGPTAADLRRDIEAELAVALRCTPDEVPVEAARYDYARRPIAILVPPPVPDRAHVEPLLADYPMVRFILLAGETIPAGIRAEYATADVLEPFIAAGHEDALIAAHERATSRLADGYEQMKEDEA